MESLLRLLSLSATTGLLDVDNALYMTSAVDPLPREQQKRAIFWGLVIEFFARMVLVVIFGFIASGSEVLFVAFGIEFTAETLSLLAAGIFLLVRSARDLVRFFIGEDEDEPVADQGGEKSFTRVLLEMSIVNAVLIDRYGHRPHRQRHQQRRPTRAGRLPATLLGRGPSLLRPADRSLHQALPGHKHRSADLPDHHRP